jgi:hypothetical protein
MNKRDLDHQREDRILVAEEDSSRNPRASLPAVILINLRVGLVEKYLVVPYVLPLHLNVDGYPQFLNKALPELVEEIPLVIRRARWCSASQEICKNRGILNRVRFSWTRRA